MKDPARTASADGGPQAPLEHPMITIVYATRAAAQELTYRPTLHV